VTPIVDPDVEGYAEAHTTPPPAHLLDVAARTRDAEGWLSQMMVGALEGRFLEFLVFLTRARRVLEIGTFTGYSALSMAEALPADGRIITCEFDPNRADMARAHFDASPHADKPNYGNYSAATLPKLAPAGLNAVDNTLWSGKVLDDEDTSDDTVALRAFNNHVAGDERVVCVQLTVRDGVTLIRHR
jgi:caffeoyl-CoA O-methyltransferase